MESYCKGEKSQKDSVNDDLESFFENIRLGKEPDEKVETYFLPKLTEEELELVERRDKSYLQSLWYSDPDVDENKMLLSESDSKYVKGLSLRKTFVIKNSSEYSCANSSKNGRSRERRSHLKNKKNSKKTKQNSKKKQNKIPKKTTDLRST